MEMKLACKDFDPAGACPFVANGENMEELKADLFKHTPKLFIIIPMNN